MKFPMGTRDIELREKSVLNAQAVQNGRNVKIMVNAREGIFSHTFNPKRALEVLQEIQNAGYLIIDPRFTNKTMEKKFKKGIKDDNDVGVELETDPEITFQEEMVDCRFNDAYYDDIIDILEGHEDE